MKRLFMSFLSIFFPWLVLLLYDNPGGALVALVMQVTIIGWLPASMWAWRVVNVAHKKKKAEAQSKSSEE